jgi:succinylglutamic semialdehyde dehydrogenase
MTDHFINGVWIRGEGPAFHSVDPARGEPVWSGHAANGQEIERAISAARAAQGEWGSLPVERRIERLNAFAEALRKGEAELAEAISRETGKPGWESREEVATMIGKVAVSIAAARERRAEVSFDLAGVRAATRFKPHGVVAVFGPFNFPGHLPNGHIVPALLAGNTVVFKPSEMTPLVGQKTVELWQASGLPRGVLNLLQGGRDTGISLANHPGLDGLFFTGSVPAGLALHRAVAGHPQRILALEMGGNNPLVVWDLGDLDAAAYTTIQSAFITAGQRCTCARRLIVPGGAEGDRFVDRLVAMMSRLRIGPYWQEPPPFSGPVVSDAAAAQLLAAQADLERRGGRAIVRMKSIAGQRPAMLSPGLIDVTPIADRPDSEIFGPLLQLVRVPSFDVALAEANRTAYGLAAGLLSDRRELYERFFREICAGVVNWNRPTTGASGKLPFGGVALSGNHRPSGYYAADYCSYPIASLEVERLSLPSQRLPGIEL